MKLWISTPHKFDEKSLCAFQFSISLSVSVLEIILHRKLKKTLILQYHAVVGCQIKELYDIIWKNWTHDDDVIVIQ